MPQIWTILLSFLHYIQLDSGVLFSQPTVFPPSYHHRRHNYDRSKSHRIRWFLDDAIGWFSAEPNSSPDALIAVWSLYENLARGSQSHSRCQKCHLVTREMASPLHKPKRTATESRGWYKGRCFNFPFSLPPAPFLNSLKGRQFPSMLRSHYSKLISGLKWTAREVNTRVEKNGVIKEPRGFNGCWFKTSFLCLSKRKCGYIDLNWLVYPSLLTSKVAIIIKLNQKKTLQCSWTADISSLKSHSSVSPSSDFHALSLIH